MLNKRGLTCTVFGVGMAMERNPEAVKAMIKAEWEVSSHGYRWIDYQDIDPVLESKHIKRTISIHENMVGAKPVGIYQGKPNERTRGLVVKEGFLYDNDAYNDDLPYWNYEYGRPHLIIPYTLDNNDMKFCITNGFNNGDQFFTYLKDALDTLIAEGKDGSPKMMSVGLHCRIVGKPGRAEGLAKFLDYVKSKGDDVWVCRRDEIASHWYKNFWPNGYGVSPEVPLIRGGLKSAL